MLIKTPWISNDTCFLIPTITKKNKKYIYKNLKNLLKFQSVMKKNKNKCYEPTTGLKFLVKTRNCMKYINKNLKKILLLI